MLAVRQRDLKKHNDFEPNSELEVELYLVKSDDEVSDTYWCDLCGHKESSKRLLRSHMVIQHLTVESSSQKKSSFRCTKPGCEKKFNKEDRLKAHIRMHEGKKPEVCPICGMELKTLRILKRHIETHNTERNHKCSYCDKAFKTKAQLEVHERYIHRKERAFICNQCGAVFYNPTGLCVSNILLID